MTSWPDPPIIAALIAALGVGLGAWLTWLASGASRLMARIESLEGRQLVMEDRAEAEAIRRRRLGDHIDVLEHHIWTAQPPPPPPRPPDI